MKCSQPGTIFANLAEYHLYCIICYTKVLRDGVFVDSCKHCKAQILVIEKFCEFCCKLKSSFQCPACQKFLCDSCSFNGCKSCFYVNHLCSSCQVFSEDVSLAQCSHLLCQECSEEQEGPCDICFAEKVCEKCNEVKESTQILSNGISLCGICRKSSEKSFNGNYKEDKSFDDGKNSYEIQRNHSFNGEVPQSCFGCGKYSILKKGKCEHSRCQECLDKACLICNLDDNKNRNHRNKQKKEPCVMCDKLEFLYQYSCQHYRCSVCSKKQCSICFGEKSQESHDQYVNNTKDKKNKKNNNSKANQKNADTSIFNHSRNFLNTNCSTCDKVNIQVNHNGCQHLRCSSCINLICQICFPDKCSSCKTKRDDLILHDCDYQICPECISSRCQICNPFEECSNCSERQDGQKLLCHHYVCYECFIFVEDDKCIFHHEELTHCQNHRNCKFIQKNGYIYKECSGQEFCFGCKNLIKKKSERKKHKKCK
jgi:hypothetical protein